MDSDNFIRVGFLGLVGIGFLAAGIVLTPVIILVVGLFIAIFG